MATSKAGLKKPLAGSVPPQHQQQQQGTGGTGAAAQPPATKSTAKPAAAISGPTAGHVSRPCNEHTFLTDVADVRQMESGLLRLLDDFHRGKLQVFGRDCTFEQMDQVREQQEKLARLHFDLDGQLQAAAGGGGGGGSADESKELAEKNLARLLEELEGLGQSVQGLKSGSRAPQPPTAAASGGGSSGGTRGAAASPPEPAAGSQLPKAPPRAARLGKARSRASAGDDALDGSNQ